MDICCYKNIIYLNQGSLSYKCLFFPRISFILYLLGPGHYIKIIKCTVRAKVARYALQTLFRAPRPLV
jgi:hypothetical protein